MGQSYYRHKAGDHPARGRVRCRSIIPTADCCLA